MGNADITGNVRRRPQRSGHQAYERNRTIDVSNIYITLRQWRVLHAVHDSGSLAEAGERLHLTQPTISYTLAKLEGHFGINVYMIQGRKAILTDVGKKLLDRSRRLLEEAVALERLAKEFGRQE
jgi:DNA-binding transcriptional LysR family regulator